MSDIIEITKEIVVKPAAVKQELGRRRNNKTRNEKVKAKSWWLGLLGKDEFDTILAGVPLTRTFKSGKTYRFVAAD